MRTMTLLAKLAAILALTLVSLHPAISQESGWLGIVNKHVTSDEANALGWTIPRGVKVVKPVPGSPAEKAGIEAEDIIVAADGVETTGSEAFRTLVGSTGAGTTVALTVVGHGRGLRLMVPLAPRPEPAASSAPPACTGRDVWAGLKESDPASYARILDAAKSIPNGGAILWRIDGKGRPSSYLFGTAHVTDDRVHALSPAIKDALASSKRLALEVSDMSTEAVMQALSRAGNLLTYEGAQSLKTKLPTSEYEALKLALQRRGMPEEATARLRPWFVGLMLSVPPCEGVRVAAGLKPLDARLAEEAGNRRVPVVGLETLDEQFQAMARLSEESQIALLRATLKTFGQAEDILETLIQRYTRRELAILWPMQLVLAEKANLPRTALEPFQKEIIIRRNRRMLDAALPYLQDGNLFIGVGALHLPGREGLVELLRKAGYTLTAVE